MDTDLQLLCQRGSELLRDTDYIGAESHLARAESLALAARDFDTLSRLYFPLQEARRQKRQRCGEGAVRLDLFGDNLPPPESLAEFHPHGQFLLAAHRSTAPALALRNLHRERGNYAEVLLAAAIPVAPAGLVIAVFAFHTDLSFLPPLPSPDHLTRLLPPHTLLLTPAELSAGNGPGTPATFARTMALWERLHLPYLALADATTDPESRLAAYRKTTDVDYACELAHQNAAGTARQLARAAQ